MCVFKDLSYKVKLFMSWQTFSSRFYFYYLRFIAGSGCSNSDTIWVDLFVSIFKVVISLRVLVHMSVPVDYSQSDLVKNCLCICAFSMYVY